MILADIDTELQKGFAMVPTAQQVLGGGIGTNTLCIIAIIVRGTLPLQKTQLQWQSGSCY